MLLRGYTRMRLMLLRGYTRMHLMLLRGYSELLKYSCDSVCFQSQLESRTETDYAAKDAKLCLAALHKVSAENWGVC